MPDQILKESSAISINHVCHQRLRYVLSNIATQPEPALKFLSETCFISQTLHFLQSPVLASKSTHSLHLGVSSK